MPEETLRIIDTTLLSNKKKSNNKEYYIDYVAIDIINNMLQEGLYNDRQELSTIN